MSQDHLTALINRCASQMRKASPSNKLRLREAIANFRAGNYSTALAYMAEAGL